jgi:hypothetical protein
MRRMFAKVVNQAKAHRQSTSYQRSWEHARAEAFSPTHRAEIDAFFSQHVR